MRFKQYGAEQFGEKVCLDNLFTAILLQIYIAGKYHIAPLMEQYIYIQRYLYLTQDNN